MEQKEQRATELGDIKQKMAAESNCLRKVVLIYEQHIEQRDYLNGKLGISMPLDENRFIALAKRLYDKVERPKQIKTVFKGAIPNNLIYFSYKDNTEYTVLFHCPPQVRYLYFTKALQKNSGNYAFPEMILGIKDNRILIAFKKGNEFYAPDIPNMGGTNQLCMGSVKIKLPEEISFDQLFAVVDDAFFNTKFSHENTEMLLASKNQKSFPWQKVQIEKMKKGNHLSTLLLPIYSTTKKK